MQMGESSHGDGDGDGDELYDKRSMKHATNGNWLIADLHSFWSRAAKRASEAF